MYQEVDLIDIALASARKQCDDAKERANRLSVTVDRLRDALSRFMSKVRHQACVGGQKKGGRILSGVIAHVSQRREVGESADGFSCHLS